MKETKMHIVKIHSGIVTPKRGTDGGAGYDIFMPEDGVAYASQVTEVPLGFSLAIPPGWAALILPRSGVGTRDQLELANTAGLIDQDFRGEWKAFLMLKLKEEVRWRKGDRLLQFVVTPVLQTDINEVERLPETNRGLAGFGTTGR